MNLVTRVLFTGGRLLPRPVRCLVPPGADPGLPDGPAAGRPLPGGLGLRRGRRKVSGRGRGGGGLRRLQEEGGGGGALRGVSRRGGAEGVRVGVAVGGKRDRVLREKR